MQSKCYCLPGLNIKIECDEVIEGNLSFLPFICEDLTADLTVKLIRSPLPEPCGKALFSDVHRAFYKNGENSYLYSYYYENPEKGYVPYACFQRNAEENILYISFEGKLWDKMIFDALNIPDLFAENSSVLLHSSFINVNGRGILFTGNKGVGKSTQAALWEKYKNAEIINGDRALLFEKDGIIFAGGTPMCGSSATALKREVPVEVICLLRQGKENIIKKIPPQRAFSELLEKITYSHEIKEITEKSVDTVLKILEKVPFYEFTCTDKADAVEELDKFLWK